MFEAERWGALFDQVPEAIGAASREGVCLYLNPSAVQLFATAREPRIVGRVIWDVFPEAVGTPFHAAFRRVAQTGSPEEFESHYPPWDRTFSNRLYLADGVVWLIATEITELKRVASSEREALSRLEEERVRLRASEERYKTFVATSAEGIYRFETNGPISCALPEDEQIRRMLEQGTLAECNDAMARMYGFERAEEIIGARLDQLLVPSDPRNVEFLRAFIRGGYRAENAESQETDRHGQPRSFVNNLVGQVEQGALVRAWGTQRDVTEQRRVEAQRTAWLTRIARLQEVTHRLSLAMSGAQVADAILEEGVNLLGATTGAIWLLDSTGARLEMLRSRGYPSGTAFQSVPMDADTPLCEAVRTGMPVWLENWAEYAARYPASESRSRQARPQSEVAIACLPLLVEGRALGGAAFAFPGARAFEDAERWFVQILTQHAAQGLARARLFDEVRASAARLEAVISASPAAIMLLDLDGTVQLWNDAAEQVFGWRREEVLGRPLPTIPDEHRAVFERNLEIVASGRPILGFEATRRRRDGQLVEVALYAAPVELPDGRKQCLTIVMDVTERKRNEDAIRRSEEAARFIAEATRLLSGSLKAEEIYSRFAQLAVSRMADWCVITLEGENGALEIAAVAHRDPEKAAWAREISRRYPAQPNPSRGVYKVVRTGEPELYPEIAPGALAAIARDEEHLRAIESLGMKSVMSVPLSAAGRVFGAMTLISAEPGRRYGPEHLRLATELASRAALAVENARLYREAERAVHVRDEFLSVASHELRTPLTPLKLKLQSLAVDTAKQPPSPYLERVRAALEASNRQVDKLSSLIGDLLDVSRIVSGRFRLELEEIDLAALVRDVVARYEGAAQEAGSALQVESPERVLGTWDRLRLDQVVTNLVDNAIKYGAGKPISLRLETRAELATLVVKDAGIGIRPEDQGRIFERFERAASQLNFGGLGLGLYITRTIVEGLQGTIRVESAPGLGATFIVELPRRPRSTASAP